MMVLVTYDVNTETAAGRRRLRNVARACQDFGQRVQKSVFECLVDPGQWVALEDRLRKTIDPEVDSLRFYFLGSKWHGKVEHVGARPAFDLEGPMVL
ncbi:MAG: CRISPR-associated protein Cas2 [Candidatus Ozemobacter sibiricus]|jgi:CRISPR-associated protein Cas2|uniref:CRISPR-associated endoribonuclease Cas2 n=1 Tax=Candidatus Ozemobacter sibiricus TaxID=2268124 RepID=A0A367ZMI5_9BACT|nr:MAG: CRISPR-associated protein Cas2 [Candidatus Ozemobacter sibiricus]